MFDIYSQFNTVSGQLIERTQNALIYVNTRVINEETQEIELLPAASSYEVVTGNEDHVSIKFESLPGADDGISEEALLKVLKHRIEERLKVEFSESLSLSSRSIQMALDSLSAA